MAINAFSQNLDLGVSTPKIDTKNINLASDVTNNTTLAFNGQTNLAPSVPNPIQALAGGSGGSFSAAKAPPPSKRSISSVKKSLLHPALTSHFECFFPPPPGPCDAFIKQYVKIPSVQDLLLISCSEASLPGSQLATHDLNNDIMGVTQKHAYRRMFDDRADFSFYVTLDPSHGYTQIKYFERWMQFIAGEQESTAADIFKPYRIKFPNDYKTNIYITKFERDTGAVRTSGAQKIVYSFFRAFPVSVTSIPVSYESSQLLKVTVSFTYDRYILHNSSISGSGGGGSSIPGIPSSSSVSNIQPKPSFSQLSQMDLGINPLPNNGEIYQFNTSQISGINAFSSGLNLF